MASVIIPPPRVDRAPGVGQRQELVGVQTFVAESPIERFHKCIVSRLARPREVQRYAVFIRPAIQGLRDKLRAIAHC